MRPSGVPVNVNERWDWTTTRKPYRRRAYSPVSSLRYQKLLTDPTHALIGRIHVGEAPVGVAVLNDGQRIAVTNSNRFGNNNSPQSLTIIDAQKITNGEDAVIGTVPAGVFPRELRVTQDQRTLLLTNFGSKTLSVIDVARLPLESRTK